MGEEKRDREEKRVKKPATNPQVILSWKAPLRAYKKRNKEVLRFYLALALLVSLIIFFFGSQVLLIPIWAILFLFYVLTTTPPPEVENRVTHFGVEAAGMTLRWENLSHFYFKKKFDYEILTIVSHPPFFYHLYLVVPNKEIKNKLIKILSNHLIYQEKPSLTLTDKMADFFTQLVPNEKDFSLKEKKLEVGKG